MIAAGSLFTTKTIFTRNINTVNGPLASKEAKIITVTSEIYVKLAAFVQTIRIILVQYASANFDTVAHVLTRDAYERLSIELSKLASDPTQNPDYETIRRGLVESLEGLYQSVIQHNILLDTQAQLSVANQNLQTLYDPVKLKAYCEMMNQRRSLFGDSNVQTTVKATLKPQYAEYIRMYGYPPGGVFDMDKLGQIMSRLSLV